MLTDLEARSRYYVETAVRKVDITCKLGIQDPFAQHVCCLCVFFLCIVAGPRPPCVLSEAGTYSSRRIKSQLTHGP